MDKLRIIGLFFAQFSTTTLASIGFKLSAHSTNFKTFWGWQIAANLTSFIGVLALTGLLRLVPVHVAYPITQGLAVIGVQLVTAKWVFKETIYPLQWLGTGLVVVGIMLITSRR